MHTITLAPLVHRSPWFSIVVSSASNNFSAFAIGIPRNLVTAWPIILSQYQTRIVKYFGSILSFAPSQRMVKAAVEHVLSTTSIIAGARACVIKGVAFVLAHE